MYDEVEHQRYKDEFEEIEKSIKWYVTNGSFTKKVLNQ